MRSASNGTRRPSRLRTLEGGLVGATVCHGATLAAADEMAAELLVRGFPHRVQWLSAMTTTRAAHSLAAVVRRTDPLTPVKVETGLPDLKSGPYFTDGVSLFRVANMTCGPGGPEVVELEDCRTLDVSLCGKEDFTEFDLLAVRPERARDAARSDGE